jgi:fumarate reductase subunit C
MTKIFFDSLKTSYSYLPRLVTSSMVVWIPIALISGLTTLFVDSVMAAGGQDSSSVAMFSLLIAVPVELVVSLIVLAVVSIRMNDWMQGQPDSQPFAMLQKYVKPLTIENLRALAKMLLWSLLLLLPGLYQLIKLSFVSFVVLFDPKYHSGQVDALAESGRLTRGLKRYLCLIFVASFLIEMFGEWFKKLPIGPAVVLTMISACLKLGFDIYFQGVTFALYKIRAQRDAGGH